MKTVSVIVLVALLVITAAAADPAAKVEITGTPHRLLIADSDKRLLAIVAADGTIEWSTPIHDEVHEAVLLPNGHVLYAEISNRIIEVDPKTGQEVWTYDP